MLGVKRPPPPDAGKSLPAPPHRLWREPWLTPRRAPGAGFGNLRLRHRGPVPQMFAGSFRGGNSFALAFADQGSL